MTTVRVLPISATPERANIRQRTKVWPAMMATRAMVSRRALAAHASLAAIRTLAQNDVSAVVVATAQPQCRRVMNELGVDVIEGVEGLTVRQAVERFVSDALYRPEGRKARVKIAVASDGDDLDAAVGTSFGLCTRFLLVDPESLDYTVVEVTPKGSLRPSAWKLSEPWPKAVLQWSSLLGFNLDVVEFCSNWAWTWLCASPTSL